MALRAFLFLLLLVALSTSVTAFRGDDVSYLKASEAAQWKGKEREGKKNGSQRKPTPENQSHNSLRPFNAVAADDYDNSSIILSAEDRATLRRLQGNMMKKPNGIKKKKMKDKIKKKKRKKKKKKTPSPASKAPSEEPSDAPSDAPSIAPTDGPSE
eukprot:jgi/Psemu1/58269/gm1.58269_g